MISLYSNKLTNKNQNTAKEAPYLLQNGHSNYRIVHRDTKFKAGQMSE